MQDNFNSAAATPLDRAMLGRMLLHELTKPDTGDTCDHAKCLRFIEMGAALDEHTVGQDDNRDTALNKALRLGFDDIAKALIDAGAPLTETDKSGNNPLMCAAVYGRKEMVELLIAKGSPLDAQNTEGHTALSWAGYYGQRDIAVMLLKSGANPDIQHRGGHTALDWTVINKSFSNPETGEAIKATVQEIADERDRYEKWRDAGMPIQHTVSVRRPLSLKK